ncbi:uncharacterized protein si:dkey-30c15.10 isoform X1 [Fundulus heteroclitus]|uniref:uncharacterized protein si:dkey-30c15.10 isoform X1 n=1 Tax=Fundulus heteroclitus TaxID=8078 RepID=UPI00165B1760|nr:uncharacterized protein si:dkey-30c15.10 isoform X1 [Fundulus heteroclitus]XP_021174682.2 uncharacterized protein si:dkey-30c15.10 isoform X1 [Fundulus heteroclitus]
MEAKEENGSNITLKRQREPLSDTEDNIVPASEVKDGLKRRRLEAAGQENQTPELPSSERRAEFLAKPDTPMIPSVRSRVQLLTQRKDGAPVAQRCFSDPGTEGPSVSNKGVREHLLGEDEFHQRMERFNKAPVSQANTTQTPSPGSTCPRSRSDFVCDIQQKLQCTTTPSSKQASIIRQERELELNQLPFQPISENAWLKRCSSDSSITQGRPPAGSSSPSSWVPVSKRKFCWPPMQPRDQDLGDAETKDGSFTEILMSAANKHSGNMMGEAAPSDVPAASEELKLTDECPKESVSLGEEDRNAKELKTVNVNRDERPGSQTVLKLSFSEENSLTELHAGDKNSFLQSTLLEELNVKETSQVSRVTEEERSEVFTFDDETMEGSTYGEEEIEPSTDEELKEWRYPQQKVSGDEEATSVKKQGLTKEKEEYLETSRGWKEKGSTFRNKSEPTDVEGAPDLDVPNKTAGFIEQQPDDNFRPEGENAVDDSLREKSSENAAHEVNTENVALTDGKDQDQGSSEIHMSDSHEREKDSAEGRKGGVDGLKVGSSKKVTFILEPELINSSVLSESDVSTESRTETSLSDAGSSSHDDTNTAETIEKMFEEVLEYAEEMEDGGRVEEYGQDHDSGIGACSGGKDGVDLEREKSEREEEPREEECDENDGDELLTFPQSGILSPLSKSVEAVVTPLRLAAAQESNPPSLLLTPEETSTPPPETAPLYSIDAYRTQRQRKLPAIQSVTPAVQRRTPETAKPKESVNTKERITALNDEAGKLQTVINQTLQALSCCTDEEHGRGSLEEAEAEKLLLVSCEKRSALLAEVARLREERNLQSEEPPKDDADYVSQQACRGTVNITNIQLPLKVEYVCSSHSKAGRPSHYFFVLIRYGPCNIIATPLATAADARNGDTISFPTTVTLKDIRSSFEIDVEVYSLCPTSGTSCTTDRTSTKSRVTPRKLLNTITKSSNTFTCKLSFVRFNSLFVELCEEPVVIFQGAAFGCLLRSIKMFLLVLAGPTCMYGKLTGGMRRHFFCVTSKQFLK